MIPLNQAFRASPVLSSIADRIQQSQQMLTHVLPLVPPGLRAHIQAGPVDESAWCLLIRNPSVSSKLRQLTPALLAHLRVQGYDIQTIRIKMLHPSR
jgi:hypothetical protein